ncbi:MAG TPA: cation-transporting P-type ATPase, partial [Gammaproteobacteria bacterium]|nr:cation-transporting P-type ATPase [Gammaproteobacteria bacterium]
MERPTSGIPSSAPAPTAQAALAGLGSTPAGLGSADAAARLAREGPNDIPEPRRHPLVQLLGKFWGLSAWMIELIAALSWLLHKWADLYVALGLLVVNAVLGFVQEQRASAAVAALRQKLEVAVRVLRDGAWSSLAARQLVRGDVVR